jgi:aminomethyltransferase
MRTPIYSAHVALKARMVDFHGWEMPIQYAGIMEEHRAVRERAGIFDLSHMGRISISGLGYERWLDQQITCPIGQMRRGQVRYGFVLNDAGGVIDDILAYKFKTRILLVVNASNREAVLRRFEPPPTTLIEDMTFQRAMIAVQGPLAMSFVGEVLGEDFSGLKYYRARHSKIGDAKAIVSRTGYTGEDGLEFIAPNERSVELFQRFVEKGRDRGIIPCGLGARDTLRLEAGMPLYGHELSAEISPLEAGLGFAVPMNKIFAGREAVLQLQNSGGPRRQLVGFKLESRRVARQGHEIFQGDRAVGYVTSGTFSPTLNQCIGLAYVEKGLAAPGTRLEVDVRGRREALALAEPRFVNRTRPRR